MGLRAEKSKGKGERERESTRGKRDGIKEIGILFCVFFTIHFKQEQMQQRKQQQ